MALTDTRQKVMAARQAMMQAKAAEMGKVGSNRIQRQGPGVQQQGPAQQQRQAPKRVNTGAMSGFSGQEVGGFGKMKPQSFRAVGGGTQNLPKEWRQQMRDEYGFKMNEQQFKAMEKNKQEMEASISKYKGEATAKIKAEQAAFDKAKGGFQAQVAARQKELDKWRSQVSSAEKKLGAAPSARKMFDSYWKSAKKIPIYVWDGKQIQGTYMAPREMVKEFDKTKGDLDAKYANKGYVLEVRQQGRIRGQEMHDLARSMSNRDEVYKAFREKPKEFGEFYQKGMNEYNKAYNDVQKAKSGYSSASRAFQSSKAAEQQAFAKTQNTINQAYKQRDHQINLVRKRRQGEVDALREQFNALSEKRKLAYSNLAKRGTYGGGATNEGQ